MAFAGSNSVTRELADELRKTGASASPDRQRAQGPLALVAPTVAALGHEVIAGEVDIKTSARRDRPEPTQRSRPRSCAIRGHGDAVSPLERALDVATTPAISPLMRLGRRLKALSRHLAERWGGVEWWRGDRALALTYRILGQLFGARRPTVSTALVRTSSRGGRPTRRSRAATEARATWTDPSIAP
jgi:hypothetical protein